MGSLRLNNKVLFIVEGESDEVGFLNQLYKKCFGNREYDIYSYKTNIHTLAQILFNEYPEFDQDDIDIQLVLKSKEEDEDKRKILAQRYSDVYLIFDFEPQHDHTHFDTLMRMITFFNDSTDHGKLYINYPMMQSYKHINILPDDSFSEKCVTLEQCKEYKKIVGEESAYTDLSKYDYILLESLAVHHVRKANRIINGEYGIPSKEEYVGWHGLDIYSKQMENLEKEGIVYILNTCIFMLIDYRPQHFFEKVCSIHNEFLI